MTNKPQNQNHNDKKNTGEKIDLQQEESGSVRSSHKKQEDISPNELKSHGICATVEAINVHMAKLSMCLAEKEQLKLRAVFNKYPLPYYYNWSHEANQQFQLLVILAQRLRGFKKNPGY